MTTTLCKRRKLGLESLETRICMVASAGWDGPGQGGAALSYYIAGVPSNVGLSRAAFETAIETALDAWSDVADITFKQTQLAKQPDALDISFKALDGPGGTLAQAYFPDDVNRNPIAGDVVFDAAESWEIGNNRGNAAFDLVLVAVHEIGHALGLSHSHAAGSVMADTVSRSRRFTGLAAADVGVIQQLYAPARAATLPSSSSTQSGTVDSTTGLEDSTTVPKPTSWLRWLRDGHSYVWWRSFVAVQA